MIDDVIILIDGKWSCKVFPRRSAHFVGFACASSSPCAWCMRTVIIDDVIILSDGKWSLLSNFQFFEQKRLNTCSYSYISTYIIVLTYKMIFYSCFQQNLLILSKISKIENPRWRPSAAILDFLFCYHGNSG